MQDKQKPMFVQLPTRAEFRELAEKAKRRFVINRAHEISLMQEEIKRLHKRIKDLKALSVSEKYYGCGMGYEKQVRAARAFGCQSGLMVIETEDSRIVPEVE